MTGKVVQGSVRKRRRTFASASPTATAGRSIPVTYSGMVPDPFRGGREIVLTGELRDGIFVGERDTLVTKCPSKFTDGERIN